MSQIKTILSYSLWPFAKIVHLVVLVRHYFFKYKIFKTFEVPISGICVGNITVGGTGKTPFVDWILQSARQKNIAVLSRGYGRKTKGYRQISPSDTSVTVGDEPLQLFTKYEQDKRVRFFVCESRVAGYQKIISGYPKTELLVLDDAFQHRAISVSCNIVLIDYNRPIDRDFLLPQGRLREPIEGLQRAHIVVVTKCPNDIKEVTMTDWERRILPYTNGLRLLFFTTVVYDKPVDLQNHKSQNIDKKQSVILVTGIAQPQDLERYCAAYFDLLKHFCFRDHYQFKDNDIRLMTDFLSEFSKKTNKERIAIMTTEKDWIRLRPFIKDGQLSGYPVYYLPISIKFIKDGAIFEEILQESVH